MEHDKCRNTYHYRYAGQNLGQSWTYNETNAQVLENLTRTWFAEYKDAGQDIIDSFHFIPEWVELIFVLLWDNDRILLMFSITANRLVTSP